MHGSDQLARYGLWLVRLGAGSAGVRCVGEVTLTQLDRTGDRGRTRGREVTV